MLNTSFFRVVVLACGLVRTCCASEPPKEIAVGDWSPAVTDNRGYAVRGRLVVAEKQSGHNPRQTAVYLDLQDASEHVGGTLRIFCDLGNSDFSGQNKTGLKCVMQDKDQRPVAFTSPPFGGATPDSRWIELPSDSTIRLRTSPFGIHRPGAMTIATHIGQVWVIDDQDPHDYFLSGTFTVDPMEGRDTITDPQIWRGTLELPAVKISNKAK